MKTLRSVLVGVLALVALGGCSDDDKVVSPNTTPESPHFIASPDSLYLSDTTPQATAYFAADAPGTLTWRCTAKPAWVTLSPESGSVTTSASAVVFHANGTGMAPGVHSGIVTLLSSGGEDKVTIVFAIDVHPRASVSVTGLQFPAGTAQRTFRLRNTGTGYLQWDATPSQSWLTVYPWSGYVPAGDSILVTATVDRQGLPPGSVNATIDIASNSEDGPISIPVDMDVPSTPLLSVSPDTLRYDYFATAGTFRVRNRGNVPLSWSAVGVPSYLQLSATSGSLAAGDSVTVVATPDRTGLPSGVTTGGFTIDTDVSQSAIIGVLILNYIESKWLLNHNVVDAEFSRASNRVVTIGESPSALYILDPEARTSQTVPLSLPPRCVSVSADGQHAAVGHNGYVSYVNLTALAVDRVYAVTTDALDVVLAENGYFYVFPVADQWEYVRCVNIASGVETLGSGQIYAGSLAKLHPSGDYIYDANNGLSPSDVEKHDIRSGTSVRLYDSPYHGDYSFGGNLWLTDDGLRLVARSGSVFRCTTTQGTDLTYNGSLTGSGWLAWVEQSGVAGRIFALPEDTYLGDAPSEMRVYESQYLGYLGVVPLPPFLVPGAVLGGTFQPGKGRFAFANAAGTRLYVLEKAKTGSGLLLDWALVPFDFSAMP